MNSAKRRPSASRSRACGFTIIELAVVLVIVSLLIGSFLYPLSTQVDQRNYADTQRRLEDVRDALITYAIVNGRFPCPALVSSPPSPSDIGIEPATTIATTGQCANPPGYAGYVPGKILGINNNLDNQGFVLDAWGTGPQNRIRYAISPANLTATGVSTFTSNGASSMRNAGISAIGTASPLLYVCISASGLPTPTATDCSTGALTSQNNAYSNGEAVFVVYSLGKNQVLEQAFGTTVFVGQPVSTSTFDDQVLWASRFTVISRLLSAGQLP